MPGTEYFLASSTSLRIWHKSRPTLFALTVIGDHTNFRPVSCIISKIARRILFKIKTFLTILYLGQNVSHERNLC
jgi:hypothetical protein